ncbi:MAG: hypothetical protein IT430_19945 [Phycisphaerales bacterium]|nr:hypothetical protein [Phycisphaerales bacterium]
MVCTTLNQSRGTAFAAVLTALLFAFDAAPTSAQSQPTAATEVQTLPPITPQEPSDAAYTAMASSGDLLAGKMADQDTTKTAAAHRVRDLAARLRADPKNAAIKGELRQALTDALAAMKSGSDETATAASSRLEKIDAVYQLELAFRGALQAAVASNETSTTATRENTRLVREALAEARTAMVQTGVTDSAHPVPPEIARKVSAIIRLLRAADEDEALTRADLADYQQELADCERELTLLDRSRDLTLSIAEASRAEGMRVQRFAATFGRRLAAAQRRDLKARSRQHEAVIESQFAKATASDAAAWQSISAGSATFAIPGLDPDLGIDMNKSMSFAELLAAVDKALAAPKTQPASTEAAHPKE